MPAQSPRHEQSAVVSMRAPNPRRALTIAAAALAVGLLAVAIGGVVLDDSGGAASSTSTSSSSTTIMTTSTNGGSGAFGTALSPAAPPTTRPNAPVLDPAQNPWSVYVSDGTVVRRLDLATGRVSERDLAPLVGDFHLVGQTAGRLVFDTVTGGVQSIGADLSGDVQSHPLWGAGVSGTATIVADLVWSVTYRTELGASIARLTDLDGRVRAAMTIPQADHPVGFIGDRALIVRRGRTYTLGASGSFEVYANGEAIAARNGFVLWVGCDDTARCTYHVGDATTPDLGITSISDKRLLRIDSQERGLAPDGQAVIAVTGQGYGRSLVKLGTGSETALPPDADQIVWTPDGSWLIMNGFGNLYALNVRDGRLVGFDLGVSNLRSATLEVVVG